LNSWIREFFFYISFPDSISPATYGFFPTDFSVLSRLSEFTQSCSTDKSVNLVKLYIICAGYTVPLKLRRNSLLPPLASTISWTCLIDFSRHTGLPVWLCPALRKTLYSVSLDTLFLSQFPEFLQQFAYWFNSV
jgi:hypothetical protein